jgi:hypothetical protein
MSSSALGLLLTVLLALGVGVAGTVIVANAAVVSSQSAADNAKSNPGNLKIPTGYGSR